MAFLAQSELEKEQSKTSNTTGPVVAGETGTINSTGQSQAQQPQQPPKATGSGFVNLTNYLEANKGNDQQIGNRVTQTVDASANKANTSTNTFQTSAQQAVQQGTTKDQGLIQAVKNAPQNVNKQQFQSQYNATYTGPQSYSDVQDYQQAAADTKRVESNVKSATGNLDDRTAVLSDTFSNPRYNSGEQRFDSFLMGSGDAGRQSIQNIQDTYKDYGSNLNKATSAVSNLIDQGRTASEATRAATRAAYDSAMGDTTSAIKDAAAGLAGANSSRLSTLANTQASLNELNEATLKQYGLTRDQAQYVKSLGYDLGSLATSGGNLTLGDVVNQQTQQKYQSLLNLLDSANPYNFTKSGNTAAVKADVNTANLLAELGKLGLAEQARIDAANAQRLKDYNSIQTLAGLSGYGAGQIADRIGINRDDLIFAVDAGIDPMKYITQGRQLSFGDLASVDDRARIAELASQLGLSRSVASGANAGGSYTVDRQGLLNAIEAERQAARVRNTPTAPEQFVASDSSPDVWKQGRDAYGNLVDFVSPSAGIGKELLRKTGVKI